MRDKIKDEEYFLRYIEHISNEIDETKKILNRHLIERGENILEVIVCRGGLADLYLIKVEALFSIGKPVQEIKKIIPDMIDCYTKSRGETGAHDKLLSMISIPIMLGIDKDDIKKLTELIAKIKFKDYLVDFLLHGLDPEWKIENVKMKIPKPYLYLQDVINAENKETAQMLLEDFVEKRWYKGSRAYVWYNSHKNTKWDAYSGYWCFVAGAVAKLLELDDSSLKDCQYYPYDMVHFEDN
ncbi:PoNe immunity protein domain-containing protein [Fusobacterium sp. PH5-44]|uniref:PoNe immunity protein domain-containing protein n=1 Tax=unclassified Fusobacterium TaxID=2648384 RepID=UPI003D21E1E8